MSRYPTNIFGRPRGAVPVMRAGKPHIWFSGGIWRCTHMEGLLSCNGRTPSEAFYHWWRQQPLLIRQAAPWGGSPMGTV